QLLAVPEAPHVELAQRRPFARAVRLAVDDRSARAADPLAAVVVERDRILPPLDELLVQDVEHLQEGHVGGDALRLIGDEAPLVPGVLLPPDVKRELHYL